MWNLVKFVLNLAGANKIATYAAIAVVGYGSFMTWMYLHDKEVARQAQEQFNKQQEEIYNKKVAEFNQQIEKIRKDTEALLEKQKQDTKHAIQEVSGIKKEAAKLGDPVPATPYLKYIIENLGGK